MGKLSSYSDAGAVQEGDWLPIIRDGENRKVLAAAFVGAPGGDGDDGGPGPSAYQVAVANGFVGDEAAWLVSLKGDPGDPGDDGQSAYAVAVANGFVGTQG